MPRPPFLGVPPRPPVLASLDLLGTRYALLERSEDDLGLHGPNKEAYLVWEEHVNGGITALQSREPVVGRAHGKVPF